MDNEPGLWHSTHRDVHPLGQTMDEELRDVLDYGAAVKAADPQAQIVAPGVVGLERLLLQRSGLAVPRRPQLSKERPTVRPTAAWSLFPGCCHSSMPTSRKPAQRLLDICTVHIYPQGGDGGDDVSPKIQALRNRSTRALWDPAYKDESWINDTMRSDPAPEKLGERPTIPGTKIGITEYNWGAEKNINGATAQADILGIFGREGLDLATRWTTPAPETPTFKAMQMYRNYDGKTSWLRRCQRGRHRAEPRHARLIRRRAPCRWGADSDDY